MRKRPPHTLRSWRRLSLANLAKMRRAVRIGELKNHLSRYLQVVRGGGSLVVMDRDVPIAEIGPVRKRGAEVGTRDDLIRRGVLIPAARRSLPLTEVGPPVVCRGDALRTLRADRDGG